jgi:hypothetical protein
MARLLMGAIVTKAVGKIGGMCFRIKNQTQILQRNPNPFKNRAINNNPAMGLIRLVFSQWKYQSDAEKTLWGVIAVNNPIRDRFGNLKTLSNREFFNRSNINTRLVGYGGVNVEDWESFTPWLNADNIRIQTNTQTIEIVNYDFDTNTRLAFYARRVNNGSNNPIPSSIQLIAFINTQDYDAHTLWNAVAAAGYIFTPYKFYSVGIRCITTSGVQSPMLQFTTQVNVS